MQHITSKKCIFYQNNSRHTDYSFVIILLSTNGWLFECNVGSLQVINPKAFRTNFVTRPVIVINKDILRPQFNLSSEYFQFHFFNTMLSTSPILAVVVMQLSVKLTTAYMSKWRLSGFNMESMAEWNIYLSANERD